MSVWRELLTAGSCFGSSQWLSGIRPTLSIHPTLKQPWYHIETILVISPGRFSIIRLRNGKVVPKRTSIKP